LTESLHTDYSDLRGTPPATLSRDRFVELRRTALEHLKTHHLAGSHEITLRGDHAQCRVSMIIWRRDESGRVLNTHCVYELEVSRATDGWRISSITQKVLWSDGDPSIHARASRLPLERSDRR